MGSPQTGSPSSGRETPSLQILAGILEGHRQRKILLVGTIDLFLAIGSVTMTRGVPVLDPAVHLNGATPEALAQALFRRVEPITDNSRTPNPTEDGSGQKGSEGKAVV